MNIITLILAIIGGVVCINGTARKNPGIVFAGFAIIVGTLALIVVSD